MSKLSFGIYEALRFCKLSLAGDIRHKKEKLKDENKMKEQEEEEEEREEEAWELMDRGRKDKWSWER